MSVDEKLYPVVEVGDDRVAALVIEHLEKEDIDYFMDFDSALKHWKFTMGSPLEGAQLDWFVKGVHACMDSLSSDDE